MTSDQHSGRTTCTCSYSSSFDYGHTGDCAITQQRKAWRQPQERDGTTEILTGYWAKEYAKLQAQLVTLTADLASAREQIAELRADVQRGYEWQRGYADRLIKAQSERDQARAQCRQMQKIIQRFVELGQDDGNEPEDAWTVAWGHAEQMLAALDQQAQP